MTDIDLARPTVTRLPNTVTLAAAVCAAFGTFFFVLGILVIVLVSLILDALGELFSRSELGSLLSGPVSQRTDVSQYVVYAILAVVIGVTLVWGAYLVFSRASLTPAIVGLSVITLIFLILVFKVHALVLLPTFLAAAALVALTRPEARQLFKCDAAPASHTFIPPLLDPVQGLLEAAPASQYAAGWYPDPDSSGNQRYFDGQQWTEHRTPNA